MQNSNTLNSADNTSKLAQHIADELNNSVSGNLSDSVAEIMARLDLDNPVAAQLGDIIDIRYLLNREAELCAVQAEVDCLGEFVLIDTQQLTLSVFPVTPESTVRITPAVGEAIWDIFENIYEETI